MTIIKIRKMYILKNKYSKTWLKERLKGKINIHCAAELLILQSVYIYML